MTEAGRSSDAEVGLPYPAEQERAAEIFVTVEERLRTGDAEAGAGRADAAYELYARAVTDLDEMLRLVPSFGRGHLARGYALRRLGRDTEAFDAYTRAIELDSHLPEVWTFRGRLYEAQGELEPALRDYREAVRLAPEAPTGYVDVGDVERALGSYDAAIADYSKAIELDPGLASVYIARAHAQAANGDIASALADIDSAFGLDGDSDLDVVDARYLRALCLYTVGRPEEAIVDFDEVIRAVPVYADVYRQRGDAHAAMKASEPALADYAHALELEPSLSEAYVGRGEVFRADGDLEAALAEYTKAVELDPQNADSVRMHGILAEGLGRWNEALVDYERVLELGVDTADAYRNRADILFELEDNDGALRDYTKAIELDPEFVAAYIGRADAYRAKRDFESAIDDFTTALGLDPNRPLVVRMRGIMWETLGNWEKALADYRQVLELGAESADAYRNLADAERALGDNEAAARDYTKAIELDPALVDAYLARGHVHLETGAQTQALNDYDSVISLDPERVAAYVGRADALAALGDDERAQSDYERALGRDPAYLDAHRGLILTLFSLAGKYVSRGLYAHGQAAYADALARADAALEFEPSDLFLHGYRGVALRCLEAYDRAVEAIAAALEQDGADDPGLSTWLYRERAESLRSWGEDLRLPERIEDSLPAYEEAARVGVEVAGALAFECHGNALTALGRYEDAIAQFRIACDRGSEEPDYERPWPELGITKAYYLLGQFKEAQSAAERLIELGAGEPRFEKWGRVALGLALERQGKSARAASELESALDHPADASAYADRAEKLDHFRAYDASERDRRRAYELAPDEPGVLNSLAWFYVGTVPTPDQLPEARKMAERAVELEGSDGPDLYHYLDTAGVIAFKLGDRAEALRLLREATDLWPYTLAIRAHLSEVEADRAET